MFSIFRIAFIKDVYDLYGFDLTIHVYYNHWIFFLHLRVQWHRVMSLSHGRINGESCPDSYYKKLIPIQSDKGNGFTLNFAVVGMEVNLETLCFVSTKN